jgi:hypothetical protein
MKIAEIVGSIADEEHETARISFMQRIANAFTRGGMMKGPLGFKGSEEPSTTMALSYPYVPASQEGTSTALSSDTLQNAGTTVPAVSDRTGELQSPLPTRHVNPVPPQAQFADVRSGRKMRQNVSNGADHRSR